jgi:hypothetical protein
MCSITWNCTRVISTSPVMRVFIGARVCSPACSIMRPPVLTALPPPSVSIISTLIVFPMSQNLRRVTEAATSVAATFFGGLTYIGNGSNLLIRGIAESRHVPAPGFLGYIIKYALPILVPVLALVGLIFFRG